MENCNDYFNVRHYRKRKKRKDYAFDVWIDKLLLIVSNIFEYKNLPANLPQFELEARLIMSGKAVVFKDEKYGIITSFGYTNGINIYNHANKFGYSQAILKSKSNLDNLVDGVIMYSTNIDRVRNTSGVIGRRLAYYADLLSDIDVSRQLLLIGGRSTQTVIAKNDNAFRELKTYTSAIIDGDLTIPKIESGVLDSVESLFKDIRANNVYTLQDLDTAQQNILKQFYTDFGIPYGYEKSERLIVPEVAANNAFIDVNINDMLQCRREGVNAINTLYGTAVTVEIGGNYDII